MHHNDERQTIIYSVWNNYMTLNKEYFLPGNIRFCFQNNVFIQYTYNIKYNSNIKNAIFVIYPSIKISNANVHVPSM